MAKFLLLYKGPATPMDQMTEEQTAKIMAGWQTWLEKAGQVVVDIGTPLSGGKSVVDNGSEGSLDQLTGYTIVQADNLEAVVSLVDGHPFLSDKTGNFSVDIYEMLPNPM